MPNKLDQRLLSWASELDDPTIAQAQLTARMPFIHGHIALMPDAHVGYGSTVGSVIPTKGAIMPSAVGVDIGCGMIAVETSLTATDLPDSLDGFMSSVEQVVPAGVGQGHGTPSDPALAWFAANRPRTDLTLGQQTKALAQFGSLGAGNHFFEVCLDERDVVWVVLHSGSRGIGNELATMHIGRAKALAKQWFIPLEDPDLAYFVQGTKEFGHYIADLHWAQEYAMANRDQMMDAALAAFFAFVGAGDEFTRVNCHHNYTAQEHHFGQDVWVTRKGAIRARLGDLGVIPGSMGTRSYIVSGLGSAASLTSCSHGAGRRHSRKAARKLFTAADLSARMVGKTWLSGKADELIDEIPDAYKDIDVVMRDQADLVRIVHTLRQILNYKGTK